MAPTAGRTYAKNKKHRVGWVSHYQPSAQRLVPGSRQGSELACVGGFVPLPVHAIVSLVCAGGGFMLVQPRRKTKKET